MIEGQMDPAVVGKFKMTPLESSMASDLKKAAEINDDVSGVARRRCHSYLVSACMITSVFLFFWPCFGKRFGQRVDPDCFVEPGSQMSPVVCLRPAFLVIRVHVLLIWR